MTTVLIEHVLRAGAVIVAAVALLVGFIFGSEHVFGVLAGGILAVGDGVGIIYIAGQLLDPRAKTGKGALLFFLFFKLAIVGLLLWVALSVLGLSGLGVVFGLGAGVAALVFGANRGSSSPAGRRATEEAEARIREEMDAHDLEDKEQDSR